MPFGLLMSAFFFQNPLFYILPNLIPEVASTMYRISNQPIEIEQNSQ